MHKQRPAIKYGRWFFRCEKLVITKEVLAPLWFVPFQDNTWAFSLHETAFLYPLNRETDHSGIVTHHHHQAASKLFPRWGRIKRNLRQSDCCLRATWGPLLRILPAKTTAGLREHVGQQGRHGRRERGLENRCLTAPFCWKQHLNQWGTKRKKNNQATAEAG